jgi:hypothetical protein
MTAGGSNLRDEENIFTVSILTDNGRNTLRKRRYWDAPHHDDFSRAPIVQKIRSLYIPAGATIYNFCAAFMP